MSATPEIITVTLNPAIDRTVTIANFAAGTVNRVEQVQDHPGGKGVNVAVTLADAGHTVAATGFLGRENATSFEDLFARKGIADQFIRIAGRTRVGIKIIDPVQQQTTDINFPGPAPAPPDLDTLRARLTASPAPWVVLAGSLPTGVAPTLYRDLIGTLKAQGRNVVLDTSGEPLAAALAAAPRIIKPNIHELEALMGRPLPHRGAVIASAQELLAAGIGLVVISMGSAGALFVTSREAVRAVPPQVVARSTVGAGDAMVAGIVAAQARGYSLEATARLATAFAVDAISRVGAGLGDPATLADLGRHVAVSAVTSALR